MAKKRKKIKKKPSYGEKVVINITHKEKKPDTRLIAIGIAVIVVIIIFGLVRFSKANAAAIVNREKITIKELDDAYALVPDLLKTAISKSIILQQLIDNKLLMQEAARLGITVSEEEVDQSIQAVLTTAGITEEMLKQNLASQNVNYEYFKEIYRRRIIATKLLSQQGELTVTEADIYDYYVQNREEIGKSLSEVEDEIRQIVEQEKFQQALQVYTEQLRQDAKIKVLFKE